MNLSPGTVRTVKTSPSFIVSIIRITLPQSDRYGFFTLPEALSDAVKPASVSPRLFTTISFVTVTSPAAAPAPVYDTNGNANIGRVFVPLTPVSSGSEK